MADEKTETPTLTEDKVRELIAAGVKDALAEGGSQEVHQPQVVTPGTPNPLEAVLRPHVEKIVAGPLLAVVSEADRNAFYNAGDPVERKLRQEHQKDVEELFQRGVQGGSAYKREDWWRYYQGTNIDKMVDARIKARETGVAAAAQEVTVDGGSAPKGGAVKKDPFQMKPEELTTAMEGVSF